MMSLAKFRRQSNTFMEFEGPPETRVATNDTIRATLYYDLDLTKVRLRATERHMRAVGESFPNKYNSVEV